MYTQDQEEELRLAITDNMKALYVLSHKQSAKSEGNEAIEQRSTTVYVILLEVATIIIIAGGDTFKISFLWDITLYRVCGPVRVIMA